jgi:hypothetical protein
LNQKLSCKKKSKLGLFTSLSRMLSYSVITLKKRGGRKKGQKVNKVKAEPYVKTEVMDSHRTHEVYGLRQVVKRKRFTDEISEPSDLDLGSHHS